MTIICYDGKTLAADKRAVTMGLPRTVTKIHKIRGHLVGCAGDAAPGRELIAWFERGADPADVPAFQCTSDHVGMLVITPDARILKYERGPYPIDFTEEGVYAFGSGRDYAMAAMALGCDARQAVELASRFDIDCGNGVDMLTLSPLTLVK